MKLPNTLRVSLLTYKAIVAVRYPELVLHDQNPTQSGHFVSHDHTVEHGGFRTVLWDAPKDLRTAVEDVVAFLTYLQNRHRDLSQGATAQLLVLCNRTAVHNQLLQHGFQFGLFAFLCLCLFCLLCFWCFLSCTVTAQWIMYRSISVLFCITLSL